MIVAYIVLQEALKFSHFFLFLLFPHALNALLLQLVFGVALQLYHCCRYSSTEDFEIFTLPFVNL